MKGATQNVALVAAGFASTVSGLLSMQVRYTDNMIDGMRDYPWLYDHLISPYGTPVLLSNFMTTADVVSI